MKRLASMLLSAFVAINILFADERPKSLIKVEYSETTKSHLTSEGDTIMTKYDFILQVAPGYSCYYNPRTYYVDSLMHDPVGKLVYDQVNVDALNEAVSEGNTEVWQLADYFNVSEEMMKKAICLYKFGNLDVDRYFGQ